MNAPIVAYVSPVDAIEALDFAIEAVCEYTHHVRTEWDVAVIATLRDMLDNARAGAAT